MTPPLCQTCLQYRLHAVGLMLQQSHVCGASSAPTTARFVCDTSLPALHVSRLQPSLSTAQPAQRAHRPMTMEAVDSTNVAHEDAWAGWTAEEEAEWSATFYDDYDVHGLITG